MNLEEHKAFKEGLYAALREANEPTGAGTAFEARVVIVNRIRHLIELSEAAAITMLERVTCGDDK